MDKVTSLNARRSKIRPRVILLIAIIEIIALCCSQINKCPLKLVCIGCSLSLRVSVSSIVWKHLLVFGLVVSVEEAVTVEELGHDVGLEGHVERRACLLALKQVGVVTHLHTGRHKTVDLIKKGKDPGATRACSETANSLFSYSYRVSDSETILPEMIITNNRDQSSWLLLLTK